MLTDLLQDTVTDDDFSRRTWLATRTLISLEWFYASWRGLVRRVVIRTTLSPFLSLGVRQYGFGRQRGVI